MSTQNHHNTVMGPECPGGPSNPLQRDLLDAPTFNPNTDKYKYRRRVRQWYEYVFSSAESGYNKAKGIASNLAMNLCSSMEEYYRTTVESAVDDGTIAFRNEDGTRLTEAEHIKTVEQILDMIAQDSPTDRVKRLVQMSKDVYNCKRKKGETYPHFAARFQSLAKAYISYAGTNEKGQDEQNFAMILLENAKLDPTTYNNIIKELVVERKASDIKVSTQVEIDAVNCIKSATKRIGEILTSVPRNGGSSDLQSNTFKITAESMSELIHLQTTLVINADTIKIPKNISKLREKLRYSITLKKTVHALQVLLTDQNGTISQDEDTSNNPDNNVKKIGTMMGSRNPEYRPKRRDSYSHRRNNRFSNRRGRYHYNSYNRKRHRSHDASDADTDDDFDNRRDDGRHKNKKKNSVFNRIGDQGQSSNGYNKQVRFKENAEEYPPEPDTPNEEDSDTNQLFRQKGPPSSRRT